MTSQDLVEIGIVIESPNISLRELWELRTELSAEVEREFSGEQVELKPSPDSRSLDPAVIGAIGMLLLPIIADKLIDILISWASRNKCSITLKVPVRGGEPLEITYNPQHVSGDSLKAWIAEATKFAQDEIG
jgi:hypothetical protein